MLTLTSPPLVKTHTSSNGRTPRFPTGGGNIRRPKAVPMTEARGGATGVIPEALEGRQYSWIGVAKRSKSSSIPDMARVTQIVLGFAPESVK